MRVAEVLTSVCRSLFDRRLRWGPTWRGWLFLAVVGVAAVMFVIRTIHPFLAISQPAEPDILVIEGWIPEYAIRRCVSIAKQSGYRFVITVGGPVLGVPTPAAEDDTHAYVAAGRLYRSGVDPRRVTMVPTSHATRDRTFQCASDLRRWLETNNISPRAINVVTLGPHARRSRLLFERALAGITDVGIIAIENEEYDPHHWWRYSEGVKEIIAESAAYLYARFLFHPVTAVSTLRLSGRSNAFFSFPGEKLWVRGVNLVRLGPYAQATSIKHLISRIRPPRETAYRVQKGYEL